MIERLEKLLGAENVLTQGDDKASYLQEWRGQWQGSAACVLLPKNAQEVAEIVKLARKNNAKIITQGGNTGLTAAQIAFDGVHDWVVSLKRMKKLREMDALSDVMIVEAGMSLSDAQAEAEKAGRLFPLSLASEGSCSIGGNIATNAGGTSVITHGNMRDLVLGLEVVLASGEIWHGLKALRKDNAGYDLKQCFIGSEGTLGIITAAALRLFPRPRGRAIGLFAIENVAEAIQLYARAREAAGLSLIGLELMPRFGLELVMKHQAFRDPLAAPSPWYVLIELSGAENDAHYIDRLMELAQGDGVIAQSEAQAQELWAMREGLSAAQKSEGPSIKHDVSVPVSKLPEFVEKTLAAIAQKFPEARPCPFGHAGDGNLHFNISVPEGFADKQAVSDLIHQAVLSYQGSIAAEHGVGLMKRDLLKASKSPLEMQMMAGLKGLFDPDHILNPGKVI